jgi:hypothetical protein
MAMAKKIGNVAQIQCKNYKSDNLGYYSLEKSIFQVPSKNRNLFSICTQNGIKIGLIRL